MVVALKTRQIRMPEKPSTSSFSHSTCGAAKVQDISERAVTRKPHTVRRASRSCRGTLLDSFANTGVRCRPSWRSAASATLRLEDARCGVVVKVRLQATLTLTLPVWKMPAPRCTATCSASSCAASGPRCGQTARPLPRHLGKPQGENRSRSSTEAPCVAASKVDGCEEGACWASALLQPV